jgi:spermidine synthase
MPLVLVLFFCSGACGLAYQVLWVRQLSFVFGVTAYAAGTVLAAFMAGLALGSWLAGPLLARITRPLAAFGIAELLIGASALATPAVLDIASSLYRTLYAVSPDSFPAQTLARFACAFAVLLVPTVLMGLTLPLLSASQVVRGPLFAARVSALYAVNTAGAVTGALLTGFVLIGALGVGRTFLLAAACNALVGLGAIALDRRHARQAVDNEASASARGSTAAMGGPVTVWWVMAASGFASLALEVVWFRLMTQALDATTYAFTVTLAGVLIGIALGGAISSRLLRARADWLAWLAVVQVATAVVVLIGVGMLTWERPLGLAPMRAPVRVVLLVLLPSLLMGISFPLLLKLGVPAPAAGTVDAGTRGKLVGRFYSVNVLGAIAGSIVGGFFIVPAFGTWAAIVILAGVFLVAGLLIAVAHPSRGRVLAMVAAGAAAFAYVTTTLPDPFMVAMRRRAPPGSIEIFRDEGVQTAVSVYESTFQRTLNVGGLHQANDSEAMVRLHRRIGMLPMALHPAPADALVIGLGGGATAGAVSQHPGTAVQIVELSDSVRKAAPYFDHVTFGVLNQPNVRVRVDDGRNFLALSGEKFDVITADIIQPIHAGAGHLYSREYFELVRQALKPGGIVLQWIGHRERSHYTLIMRTFLEVFPDATLWLGGEMMVGSLEPLTLNQAAFDAKLLDPETRAVLLGVGLGSFEALRSWYAAGPREMRAYVGDGPRLTDDRPLVEYHRSLPPDPRPLDLSTIRGSVDELGGR